MPFLPAGVGAAIAGGAASAAVAGGIGLIGSSMQKKAVDNSSAQAVQAQQVGQEEAIAAQERAREQARADLEPWRTAGGAAIPAVQNAAGINGPEGYDAALAGFHTSPGYQWQLDQGLRAVDAGAAAKGLLRSGATLKAEQAYGTGLADKEFTDYYNRLFDLSKLGESAAALSADVSTKTGSGIADASTSAAKGIAQTDLSLGSAEASIYGNAAKGLGDVVGNFANNSLYGSKTNALMSGYGSDPSWASLNRTNPTIAPNTWSSQPDSYYLPGGGGYQI